MATFQGGVFSGKWYCAGPRDIRRLLQGWWNSLSAAVYMYNFLTYNSFLYITFVPRRPLPELGRPYRSPLSPSPKPLARPGTTVSSSGVPVSKVGMTRK